MFFPSTSQNALHQLGRRASCDLINLVIHSGSSLACVQELSWPDVSSPLSSGVVFWRPPRAMDGGARPCRGSASVLCDRFACASWKLVCVIFSKQTALFRGPTDSPRPPLIQDTRICGACSVAALTPAQPEWAFL